MVDFFGWLDVHPGWCSAFAVFSGLLGAWLALTLTMED